MQFPEVYLRPIVFQLVKVIRCLFLKCCLAVQSRGLVRIKKSFPFLFADSIPIISVTTVRIFMNHDAVLVQVFSKQTALVFGNWVYVSVKIHLEFIFLIKVESSQRSISSDHAHVFVARMDFNRHKAATFSIIMELFCYCNRHPVTIV